MARKHKKTKKSKGKRVVEKPKYNLTFEQKQALCAKRRAILIKRATPAELRFKKLLENLEVKFVFQQGFYSGCNFCIADFYIPSIKTVVEVDGEYHLTKTQKKRDKEKDAYYKTLGLNVFRITNEDALKLDESLLEKILGV